MPKKVILCVDDERIVLTSLRTQMKKHFGRRYQYEFAESAAEALEVIDTLGHNDAEVILIVVSDWLMPDLKGDEFLIRVHEKYPKIIKVMLTGQADKQAIERAEKFANLHSCIPKPWHEDDLIRVLESGLEGGHE